MHSRLQVQWNGFCIKPYPRFGLKNEVTENNQTHNNGFSFNFEKPKIKLLVWVLVLAKNRPILAINLVQDKWALT